jgi:hypothetical protein
MALSCNSSDDCEKTTPPRLSNRAVKKVFFIVIGWFWNFIVGGNFGKVYEILGKLFKV